MNNASQALSEIDCSTDSVNAGETSQNDEDSSEDFLEQRNTAEAESPDIVPNDEKNYQEKDPNKIISDEEIMNTDDESDDNIEGDSKQIDNENNDQFNDKPDIDLPDVVPERSETPGKQDEVSSPSNGNATGNDFGTLRSILKRESNKKNLHVSFSDSPVIYNETSEPMNNLISLLDSSFDIKVEDSFWDEFDKTDEKEVEQFNAVSDNEFDLSGSSKDGITRDNLSHFEQFMLDANNLDSDSETNSSQDTVILMTTEENKRNQESIQQSQRRFQLQKTNSGYDSPSSRTGELRSNSAVRKCLERTALRRSLTQCANTRRKTLETKPSTQVPSIMDKLRLLTRDSDDVKTGQTSGEVAAAMNSLPRLDLQQVHDMINTRCPLKDVYSNPKEIDVPGDVREWKMSSKLWEHDDEVNDNVDELERFVQQDWERIERVRQRYTPEPKDAFMELCRRPSVRGIRPRFGSTHQIINQLQQQRQPPPYRHESLSNINCVDNSRELEYSHSFQPKLSQSFQSLDETKWPLYVTLASSNPNRLSCPPEYFQPDMHFSPDYLQNSNRLSSCESTTRFVSDV